jgi:hypothetical protein
MPWLVKFRCGEQFKNSGTNRREDHILNGFDYKHSGPPLADANGWTAFRCHRSNATGSAGMGHERAKSIQAVSGLAEQSTAKENLHAQRGWLTTSRKLIYFIASRAAQRERLDFSVIAERRHWLDGREDLQSPTEAESKHANEIRGREVTLYQDAN